MRTPSLTTGQDGVLFKSGMAKTNYFQRGLGLWTGICLLRTLLARTVIESKERADNGVDCVETDVLSRCQSLRQGPIFTLVKEVQLRSCCGFNSLRLDTIYWFSRDCEKKQYRFSGTKSTYKLNTSPPGIHSEIKRTGRFSEGRTVLSCPRFAALKKLLILRPHSSSA